MIASASGESDAEDPAPIVKKKGKNKVSYKSIYCSCTLFKYLGEIRRLL